MHGRWGIIRQHSSLRAGRSLLGLVLLKTLSSHAVSEKALVKLLYGSHTAPSAFPSTWAICILVAPQDQHSSLILFIFSFTWDGNKPDITVLFLLLDGRGGGGGMRLLLDAIVSIALGLRETRTELKQCIG